MTHYVDVVFVCFSKTPIIKWEIEVTLIILYFVMYKYLLVY